MGMAIHLKAEAAAKFQEFQFPMGMAIHEAVQQKVAGMFQFPMGMAIHLVIGGVILYIACFNSLWEWQYIFTLGGSPK